MGSWDGPGVNGLYTCSRGLAQRYVAEELDIVYDCYVAEVLGKYKAVKQVEIECGSNV